VAEPTVKRPGRNEPCHCGSGKKYKHCCLEKDEEADRAARAAQAATPAAAPPAEENRPPQAPPPRRPPEQPWRQRGQGARPFLKVTPRKVGS